MLRPYRARPEQDATLLAVLSGRKQRTHAPIVVIAPGGLEPELEEQYREAGIALFHETALGFDVLAAHRAAGEPASFADSLMPSAAARAAAARVAGAPDDVLSEVDSAEILRQLGVPMVESRDATTLVQAVAAADALVTRWC